MRALIQQTGRTAFIIIRTLAIGISVIALLLFLWRFFWGVLVYDTAADDTIKELNTRAVSVSGQILNGQKKISEGEFSLKTRKGYLVQSYLVDNHFFEITLSGVPQEICQRILKKNWTMPTSVYLNDALIQQEPVLCSESNKMSFEFSRDLSENIPNSEKPRMNHCLSDSMCPGCSACRNGLCKSSCSDSGTCSLTLTTQSVCCSAEKQTQGLCCSFVEDGRCCWGRGKCCPFDKPIYTTDGRCVDCSEPTPFSIGIAADLTTCTKICPNRVSFGKDNLCMLPICSNHQFLGQDGVCYDCTQEGGIISSESECKKCSDRTYQDSFCQQKCPQGTLQNSDGKCISCTDLEAITPAIPDTCETACPNRQTINQVCALTECPQYTLKDASGNCISCDTPTAIGGISADTCAQCPERIFQNNLCQTPCADTQFRSTDGTCQDCQDKSVYPVVPGSAECNRCPNRLFLNGYCFASCTYSQFRDALGTCHDCQDLTSAQVLQTASCSLCPNRSIILKQNGKENIRFCALQYCPTGYFRDSLGNCHDCLTNKNITGISKSACEQCDNRMWSPIDSACLIKSNCQPGEVQDTYGKCHTCSENAAFRLDGYLENCDQCPNRYLFGTWCQTCPADMTHLKNKESCQKCRGSWDNRTERCY